MLNNIVWVIFDSARNDAFAAARTPAIDRIGRAKRSFSYASWTAPSHYAFLMGLTPHANLPGLFATDVHRSDFARWAERMGGDAAVSFANFAPKLSLPAFLKGMGYRTEAYVSLPVLNPATLISRDFDRFELMPSHNDLGAIIDRLVFDDEPRFILINTGETHYPYALPGEDASWLPRLSGVHGLWRSLDDFLRRPGRASEEGGRFDEESLRPLWRKQVACIEHLDREFDRLLELAPPNTWFMLGSDHGELFGEGGLFGHGPVFHEKVFEVFFVEGLHPSSPAERSR